MVVSEDILFCLDFSDPAEIENLICETLTFQIAGIIYDVKTFRPWRSENQ